MIEQGKIQELVDKSKQGDMTAFAVLVSEYQPFVCQAFLPVVV